MQSLPVRRAPMQLIALAFDNLELDLRIWHTVNRLEHPDVINLVDSLALTKTIHDEIIAIEMTDLPTGQAGAYGGIIRRLLEIDVHTPPLVDSELERALGRAMLVYNEYEYGMTGDELETVLDDIPRRGGVIMLLLEHVWALPLREAVMDEGGYLLAQDFLSPEILASVANRLLRSNYR
jgi:hypothetical protein